MVVVVVVVVAGNGVETTIGIGIGTGTEIRTPPPEQVAVVVVLTEETEMGSGFASAGRPAELKLTRRRRAGPIRTCITSAGAAALVGGRRRSSNKRNRRRGTGIAGGRTVVEGGIVSTSLGRAQAETRTGAREVRDTKEGMHDDDVVSIFARGGSPHLLVRDE